MVECYKKKKNQTDIFTREWHLKIESFTHISPWQISSDEEWKSERSDIALSVIQPEKYHFGKKIIGTKDRINLKVWSHGKRDFF